MPLFKCFSVTDMDNFTDKILGWYGINHRKLPWRETKDPYKIWVSEIIMQQTRIDQGTAYYQRFIETFPDINSLAGASEQDVLQLWKGLGYYSRARNMHTTAMFVRDSLNAVFPSDFATLIKLKGIGHYTASAISSICAGEARPVVDGNVVRVISRIFGIHDPVGSAGSAGKVFSRAEQLISHENPGDFNQAMMEFGAIHCKPAKPLCSDCIFQNLCVAFNQNLTASIPAKKKEIQKRTRWLNYLFIHDNSGHAVFRKRTATDIWKNLFDPPVLEAGKLLSIQEIGQDPFWHSFADKMPLSVTGTTDFRHILTHQIIHARFFEVKVPAKSKIKLPDADDYQILPWSDAGLPVSRLVDKYIQTIGLQNLRSKSH